MTFQSASSEPLVAIVTPVYNGAPFLADCLDSVQRQTYGNVVHIVLDNASTDETANILSRYSNAKVPVLVKRNERTLSIGDNWNAAATLVPKEAAYFRFLCADDFIEPTFVEKTVSLAERYPNVVVVGCRVQHREGTDEEVPWDGRGDVFPGQEAVRRFFEGSGFIIAHQTLIRRKALEWRSAFFDASLAAMDTDACLDILRRGDWGFVHEVLTTTRDHPGTHSRAVQRLMLHTADYLILLERHAEFAFGKQRAREFTSLYRRYYLRQLLRWRVRGAKEIFDRHIALIRKFKVRPLAFDFLDAITDWPLVRLHLRGAWSGYPFSDAP